MLKAIAAVEQGGIIFHAAEKHGIPCSMHPCALHDRKY